MVLTLEKVNAIAKAAERSRLPNIEPYAPLRVDSSEFEQGTLVSRRSRGDIVHMAQPITSSRLYSLVDESFDIWLCQDAALGRFGQPLYVEIAYRTPNPSDQLDRREIGELWNHLLPGDSTIQRVIREDCVDLDSPRPVYTPADTGCPHGWLTNALCRQAERRKALFVAFYGLRNPRTCSHCTRNFETTISAHREHVLYPFHACVTLGEFFGGRCANCIWSSQTGCCWAYLSGYRKRLGDKGGAVDRPLQGLDAPEGAKDVKEEVDYLNHTSAPRVSCKLPRLEAKEGECEDEVAHAAERAALLDRLGFRPS